MTFSQRILDINECVYCYEPETANTPKDKDGFCKKCQKAAARELAYEREEQASYVPCAGCGFTGPTYKVGLSYLCLDCKNEEAGR